jgi:hypothetical protein
MRRVRAGVVEARRGCGRGSLGDLVERVGDGGVVGGGGAKACFGQPPARCAAQGAAVGLQLFDQRGIVGHAGHDGHVFKVLGRGAHHRRAADVDVFDEMAEGDAGLGGGLLEGVEIDHHHVDGLDAVRGDGGFVLGVAANVEQAAMDAGMQGLHAAVEHLRKAGQVADVLDRQAGLAQRRAVPPVEISSTPKPASAWANSTRPVLSVTLSTTALCFWPCWLAM